MKFSDIPGHEDVKRRLRSMVVSDKIPHALLFEGIEGIGKLAMARAFAQYVHCTEKTPDGEPCGHCDSCLQHATFNHPDLFYVFPIYKKGSEQTAFCDEYLPEWHQFLGHGIYSSFSDWVNTLNPGTKQPVIYNSEGNVIIHKASIKSYAAKYKIMIMWLPEKLKTECSNRLLKMIEEPYENTLFLFVSNESEKILPTIYSRIQRILMKRLPNENVADYLMRQYAVDSHMAKSLAELSEGSATRAISLLDVETDNMIFLDFFKQLMRLAYMKDVRNLKIWSEEVAELKREKICLFLTYTARMLRENFIYNLNRPKLNYMTTQEEAFSSKFSPFVNERNIEILANETDRANADIARNANAKIVLFDYAIKVIVALRK